MMRIRYIVCNRPLVYGEHVSEKVMSECVWINASKAIKKGTKPKSTRPKLNLPMNPDDSDRIVRKNLSRAELGRRSIAASRKWSWNQPIDRLTIEN